MLCYTEVGGGSATSSTERNYCHFELTDADRSDYFDRISELYDQQILCDLVLKVRSTVQIIKNIT
jgi:hypothetical protein